MFVYSLLAVRGLGSCVGFSPVAASRGTLLAVPGFSLRGRLWLHSSGSRVPSFSSCGSWVSGSQALSRGSVVLVDGACGIFPGQGPNPGLLHWQADSSPLSRQGSPEITKVKMYNLSACDSDWAKKVYYYISIQQGPGWTNHFSQKKKKKKS